MARRTQGKKAPAASRRVRTPTRATAAPVTAPAATPNVLTGTLSGLMGQIGGLREQAVAQIHDLEHALAAAKAELATIDGLMGRKTAPTARKAVSGGSGKRMPRGYWRDQVLKALDRKPDGLNKSELLAALDAKGNAQQEASVSNTLAALKKAAEITHEGGRYAKVA